MSFNVNVKLKYNSLKNQCFGPLWLFNAVARVAKVYWANRIGPIGPNVSRCFESLTPWNAMMKHEEPQHYWNGLNPQNCQKAGKVTHEFKMSRSFVELKSYLWNNHWTNNFTEETNHLRSSSIKIFVQAVSYSKKTSSAKPPLLWPIFCQDPVPTCCCNAML